MLTAAHCVTHQNRNSAVVPIPKDELELIFGTFSSMYVQINKIGAIKRSIKKITSHEEYKFGVAYYDVAIIELTQPLVFSPQIQPICVPKSRSQVK